MNRDQDRSVVMVSRTRVVYNRSVIVQQSCKIVEKLNRDRFPGPFSRQPMICLVVLSRGQSWTVVVSGRGCGN